MKCPKCAKDFDSEIGVKVHYGKAHEGSISGYDTECSFCGESLTVRQKDRVEGNNFCDNKCESKYRSDNGGGENHPLYDGGKVTVACLICSTQVKRWPAKIEQQERVFCSKSCQGKWRGENWTGEDNPNYDGGVFEHQYGPNWANAREQAIEQADGSCEEPDCQREECRNGYNLDVHHIIPRRHFDDKTEANELDNLLVLCREHHAEIEPNGYGKSRGGT
jgi:endogenous inhibitor of DNA gyrase (YacG/DUF329 family)